jgi:hypothetical protein
MTELALDGLTAGRQMAWRGGDHVSTVAARPQELISDRAMELRALPRCPR